VHDIEALLRRHEVVPEPGRPSDVKIRDPDDAWIPASAVDAKADVIVTGDPDLLTLGMRTLVPPQTPREFWNGVSGA